MSKLSNVKERPILMTPENAQKCHDGTKTQTRRLNGLEEVNTCKHWDYPQMQARGVAGTMTNAERERLIFAAEEMAEVIQQISKVLRHGWEAHNPYHPERGDNREQLTRELGDVLFAIELLCASRDLNEQEVDEARGRKSETVWQWFYHQERARKQYGKRWPSCIAAR